MKKIPISQQIVMWLKERIQVREFLPGGELPSESELCRRFSSSRSSVRKALEQLELEQVIFRKPGVGSFVRDVDSGQAKTLLNIGISNISYCDWYTADIFAGASAACAQCHAQLVYVDINEYLATQRIPLDGLIVLAGEEGVNMAALEQLAAAGLPVALLNRFTDLSHISYFSVDYERESEKAIDFMLTQGVRRIGAVYDEHDSVYALKTRLRGYENACLRLGMTPEKCGISDIFNSTEIIRKFLDRSGCDGLFMVTCRGLNAALEVRRLAAEPKPMIMCFDKLNPQMALGEDVASIEMPLHEIAFAAVQHLVARQRVHGTTVIRKLYDSRFVLNSRKFERPTVKEVEDDKRGKLP